MILVFTRRRSSVGRVPGRATPPLFGTTPVERAQIDMWIRRTEFVLMAPIGAVWVHTHALTAALGTQFRDYGEAQRLRVGRAMAWLDGELAAGPFIAGDRFSM